VRFTLDNPEIFRTQIEAILMAGAHGPVRILFPLITSLDEVRRCKAVVTAAREALTREGVAFGQEVPLGIMIEVPAAVWQAPAFALEVDFFSVGTNDLVQYLLAADRTNPLVSQYYDHLHPAVLAALRHVAEAAHRGGCGLSICGEMATEPRAFLLLFGLGYREFSLPAPFIPRMKQLLAGISSAAAAETAAECLRQGDASRVASLLDEALERVRSEKFSKA
jgi:phosphotransferase system enzyme I (PtsP)